MTTKKKPARKSVAVKGRQPKVPPLVQEALQVTWLLKGNLKNIQISYIRVGILLARVRDRKLWAELKHPDIESYAEARLKLRRASLFRYLQVHDWIAKFHKEWLAPHPQGYIPELSDAFDLMWIDEELARKDLDPRKRAGLKALQSKAMAGELRSGELAKWRRTGGSGASGMKSFLSKLRLLRRRGAELASMPEKVIEYLDAAIGEIDKTIS